MTPKKPCPPEKTEEITTIIYQDSATAVLQTLYGEID